MAAEVTTPTAEAEQGSAKRRGRRFLWLYEVALIAVGYAAYTYIRNLVHSEESTAIRHAQDIVSWEKTLGIYHELGVNHFLAGQHWLAYICNYYYAVLHFAVTIAVGVWVYWKHPWYARRLRNAWYFMNLFALIGFVAYALAPPRLLPGADFIDTVVKFHTWGSWGDPSVAQHSNQFAAMPSMHIGWSTWCALVIVHLAKHRWVKVLGALYPFFTLFVIVGTGNHYFLDAVGGLIALALGFAMQRAISHRKAFEPPPTGTDVRDMSGRSFSGA
jgi:hypothetical protein